MLQLTTILLLISFSLLSVLHFLALKLHLYWQLAWFDIPMHFFGGAIVALGVFTLRDLRFISSTYLTPKHVVGFVLFVAVVWELFEFYAGLYQASNYYADTSLDVVMGLLGGLVGYFIGKRLHSL